MDAESIPRKVVNAGLLARSGGMPTGRGYPITANGPKGRTGRTSPLMHFRDLPEGALDGQTGSSTPNPGFDERQPVLATV
jgi:hypothetical protein